MFCTAVATSRPNSEISSTSSSVNASASWRDRETMPIGRAPRMRGAISSLCRPRASRSRSSGYSSSASSRRMTTSPPDEPADDQPRKKEQTGREGDAVPEEGGPRRSEVMHSPPLDEPEDRKEEHRQDDAAGEAVAKGSFDDDRHERKPRLVAVLVRE